MTTNYEMIKRELLGLTTQDSLSYTAVNRELYKLLTNDEVLCANKTAVAQAGIDYSVNLGQTQSVIPYPINYIGTGIYYELKSNSVLGLNDGGTETIVTTYKPLPTGTVKQMALTENSNLWIRTEMCSHQWSEWVLNSVAGSFVKKIGDTMTGNLVFDASERTQEIVFNFGANRDKIHISGECGTCNFQMWSEFKRQFDSPCTFGGTPTGNILKYDREKNKIILGDNEDIYVYNGNGKIWHECNMGQCSGLDADTLDGQHLSDIYECLLTVGVQVQVIEYSDGTITSFDVPCHAKSAIVYVTGAGASGSCDISGQQYGGGAGATAIGSIVISKAVTTFNTVIGAPGVACKGVPQASGMSSSFVYSDYTISAEGGRTVAQAIRSDAFGGIINLCGDNYIGDHHYTEGIRSFWGSGGEASTSSNLRNSKNWGAGGGHGSNYGGIGCAGVVVIHWYK